jgi:hypothetical protein
MFHFPRQSWAKASENGNMRHISMFLRQHVTFQSGFVINNAQAAAISAFVGQIAYWAASGETDP